MPDVYQREQRPSLSTGRPRPMLADSANYTREQRAAIPMAHCSVKPHSAFALGWTYGPITLDQHRSAHRYARACFATIGQHEDIRTVPGFWLMPPVHVR